jgi:hypothetical protein
MRCSKAERFPSAMVHFVGCEGDLFLCDKAEYKRGQLMGDLFYRLSCRAGFFRRRIRFDLRGHEAEFSAYRQPNPQDCFSQTQSGNGFSGNCCIVIGTLTRPAVRALARLA